MTTKSVLYVNCIHTRASTRALKLEIIKRKVYVKSADNVILKVLKRLNPLDERKLIKAYKVTVCITLFAQKMSNYSPSLSQRIYEHVVIMRYYYEE